MSGKHRQEIVASRVFLSNLAIHEVENRVGSFFENLTFLNALFLQSSSHVYIILVKETQLSEKKRANDEIKWTDDLKI